MSGAVLELEPLTATVGRRMEQVIAAVRAAIDNGRMAPGVKYSVYQLADVLGVSRTPVREALLRLEEVGLIKFEARQGFRIILPQPKEIAEIFAVRIALEIPAVRKVAALADQVLIDSLLDQRRQMRSAVTAADEALFARHDVDFHDLILEAAGNNRVREIVKGLRETTRLLGASTAENSRTLADIDEEHTPILDAISTGDPNAAGAAMLGHLEHTGKLLVRQALRSAGATPQASKLWDGAVL